jgi:glutathione synthase/RimK-type ligase-like ATP-grasp enzyme
MMDLPNAFPNAAFLNNPKHACEIGNKAFLDTLFQSSDDLKNVMPNTKLCRSVQDVKAFAARNKGRIVLKTLQGYGGTGVKRYGSNAKDADIISDEGLTEFLYMEGGTCIAMERLDHPEQEDNRLLVVNGQIVGTLKRRAKDGAFLCNMCAGGKAELGYPNADEINIVRQLSPMLEKHDLRFVGIDTLRHIDPITGQERRYLSEINTLNTGGLSFMNELTGRLVLETATDLMIDDLLSSKVSNTVQIDAPKLRQHYALTAGFSM